MQKPSSIPTPLVAADQQAPIKIVPIQKAGHFRAVTLLLKVFSFGFSMLWAQLLRRLTPEQSAQRLRAFLEDMGGLWVKAGQLVSMRIDLLSPEMVHELTQLQYHTYGFDPALARAIVAETIGCPLEQVFDVFEDLPFAAASISQVHRAHLRDQDAWVAIKVQRPGITELFERDAQVIAWLLTNMGRIPSLSFITWDGMVRELRQIMREELDYRYEEANLRRMRKLLRRHKVYVPRLYRRLSGPRIITMEMVEGVLMSDYLQVSKTDPQRIAAWCAENNIKPKKLGRRLLKSFYRQLFEDNLFHGDLHPGNIILFRSSRFALIDLGTIGNLEQRFVNNYRQQLVAVANHDYGKAAELYLLMSDSIPVIDIAGFKADLVELYRNWEARSNMEGLPYIEKTISGGVATEVSVVARRYKVNPSWQFLRVARAMSTLDANLNALLGDTNPVKIMRQYTQEAQRRTLRRLPRKLLPRVISAAGDIGEASTYVADSLRRQALQLQGVQTATAYIFSLLFKALRLGLVLAASVLVYVYLYRQHWPLIENLRLDFLGGLINIVPPYGLDVAVLTVVIVALALWIIGRIEAVLTRPTPRLPSGQLDR